MDAASSCSYSRAVGSDGDSQPSVHIVAGNLHIVVSTEDAGHALQRETQADSVAVNGGAARFNRILVDMSFEDGGMSHDQHDAVAVALSVRGASQPAGQAADSAHDRDASERAEEEAPDREDEPIAAQP